MLTAGLLLIAATAGQPTYLKCDFSGFEVDVTADEPNSAVTLSMPSTGNLQKLTAAFTPTEVRFGDKDMAYVLSRTNLIIDRTTFIFNETKRGTCAVQTAPKRAF